MLVAMSVVSVYVNMRMYMYEIAMRQLVGFAYVYSCACHCICIVYLYMYMTPSAPGHVPLSGFEHCVLNTETLRVADGLGNQLGQMLISLTLFISHAVQSYTL